MVHKNAKLASLKREKPVSSSRRKHVGAMATLVAIVGGVVTLFFLLFGEQLRPAIPVKVTSVLLLTEDHRQGAEHIQPKATKPVLSDKVVAQASGWVEPEPYPVRVPVETDGFVERVEVLEGEEVKEGDLLATLDAVNQVLMYREAKAMWEEAALKRRMATSEMIQASNKVHIASNGWLITQAEVNLARDRYDRLRGLQPEDFSEREMVEATQNLAKAEAALKQQERNVEVARLEYDRLTLKAKQLQAAERVAFQTLERAQLDVQRTRIFAPMDGVVLKRFVEPGMKRMMGMEGEDSATIVTLYDPQKLQVRTDVALADVGNVFTGMFARIGSAVLGSRVVTGKVTRMVGEADITRNTLQVKVELMDPPSLLKPEMLCRVEFVESDTDTRSSEDDRGHYWVLEEALTEERNGEATLWVVDMILNRANPRKVRVGSEKRDGYRKIIDGIMPGEKVVVESDGKLTPNSRIKLVAKEYY